MLAPAAAAAVAASPALSAITPAYFVPLAASYAAPSAESVVRTVLAEWPAVLASAAALAVAASVAVVAAVAASAAASAAATLDAVAASSVSFLA